MSNEIAGAKRSLECLLSRPIIYFAYPKGRYSSSIVEMVKKSGYLMGLTMDSAPVLPKVTSLFLVPRIGIDASHSPAEFQDTLSPVNIYLRRKLGRFNPRYEIA
jgi:hypothetical protein